MLSVCALVTFWRCSVDIDPKTVCLVRDNVLLRIVEYRHDILEVRGITLNKGIVVAVGPGRRKRRLVHYRPAEHEMRSGLWLEDGAERSPTILKPMPVAVDDCVEFTPYKHQISFTHGDERYVILPATAIYAKDPNYSQSQAILSARGAGYDRDGTYLARG